MNNKHNTQISYIEVQYHKNLAYRLFTPVEHLPWSMLLCSSSDSHVDSRFDILVSHPMATLSTTGIGTDIQFYDQDVEFGQPCQSIQQPVTSTEDVFTLLERYQHQLLPSVGLDSLPFLPKDCPFIGGVLGYFSYDLGRRIENIPSLACNDIHAPDMAVGIYDTALIVDHQEKSAYAIGTRARQLVGWINAQNTTDTLSNPPFRLTSDWLSNLTKDEYARRFQKIQDYLLSGDCYQVNLAQRFCADYTGSEWDAFQTLNRENAAPFSAFIRTDKNAILSISPERFLQLDGTSIETKPIKGTRPRFSDEVKDKRSAESLRYAEKDQAENLMIVDLLRNDIGRVAKPGTVQVPKLFDIESFPAVHHLVSTISAELDKQYSATDLLRACFPGGSITGAPKIRAMAIIEELEPHRRSTYCGSIGYISRHGVMDTSITIRTLIASNAKMYAWAGGGIVADSECDAEYQETFDKLACILPVLKQC